MEKIIMDRHTLKALASDKKREILKMLSKSQLTLSDIAKSLGMSASTIKEHLDDMRKAGLIEQKDDGHKWKYYVLTQKGKELSSPEEKRIYLLMGMAAMAVILTGQRLLSGYFMGSNSMAKSESMLYAAPAAGRNIIIAADAMTLPYLEIALFGLSLFALGLFIGYILKIRKDRKEIEKI